MLSVVFDANIYISAIIRSDGIPAKLISLWRQNAFEVLATESIFAEVRNVAMRPRVRRLHKLKPEAIKEVANRFCLGAKILPGNLELNVVKSDPNDNHVLACAVEGKADYLVTGDKAHLLLLKEYKGIKIVTPAEFLKLKMW